jgi:hypothetical protein
MTDSLPSSEFYLRKAEELRRLAEAEVIPAVRDQHLRIAAMYQALADHCGDRSPTPSEPIRRPTISIPTGVLRPR